jgi:hypothetical protein
VKRVLRFRAAASSAGGAPDDASGTLRARRDRLLASLG